MLRDGYENGLCLLQNPRRCCSGEASERTPASASYTTFANAWKWLSGWVGRERYEVLKMRRKRRILALNEMPFA